MVYYPQMRSISDKSLALRERGHLTKRQRRLRRERSARLRALRAKPIFLDQPHIANTFGSLTSGF
jgi:hypothetical protein